MKPYTQPDFNKDIKILREQVEHDYNQMVKRFKLPKRLDFLHACKAVLVGGLGINDNSPYEIFKEDLFNTIILTVKKKAEIQDIFEILTGVWNHFPHSDLNGLSPIEKIRNEHLSLNIGSKKPFPLNKKKYATEIDREVLSFSEKVANNLLEYLEDIGLGKKEQKHILDILSDPSSNPNDALMYLFTQIIDKKSLKQETRTIDDIQPAVRALMWCENYTASKMSNGHLNSRMFQNIVEQTIKYNESTIAKTKKKKSRTKTISIIDPLQVLKRLSMIHDMISNLSEKFDIEIGIEEATKHIVDWLALTDIQELLTHKDSEIATFHFLGVAQLIAVTGDPKQSYKNLKVQLHEEISRQIKPEIFNNEIKRIAKKVLGVVQDPIMLMPYPGKLSNEDDCINRLTKLNPNIKSHQSLGDDLLPIPSPFFPYL
ncbi:MAG: hypothetical protein PHX25_03385 [Candidatus Pacebacteria bacterium]|nr:hypothetical protein [Candidatus Paceibacterota bacterium]